MGNKDKRLIDGDIFDDSDQNSNGNGKKNDGENSNYFGVGTGDYFKRADKNFSSDGENFNGGKAHSEDTVGGEKELESAVEKPDGKADSEDKKTETSKYGDPYYFTSGSGDFKRPEYEYKRPEDAYKRPDGIGYERIFDSGEGGEEEFTESEKRPEDGVKSGQDESGNYFAPPRFSGENGDGYYSSNPYGVPPRLNETAEDESKNKGLGIASMILGIISVICCCMDGMAIVTSILAIVFSAIRMKSKADGFAVAGLILGIVGALFNIGMILVVASGLATEIYEESMEIIRLFR